MTLNINIILSTNEAEGYRIEQTPSGMIRRIVRQNCPDCGGEIWSFRVNAITRCKQCKSKHDYAVKLERLARGVVPKKRKRQPAQKVFIPQLQPGYYKLMYYHPLYAVGRVYDYKLINSDIAQGIANPEAFQRVAG